jgi:hypothetical protein
MNVRQQVCVIAILFVMVAGNAFAQTARVEKHLAGKQIKGPTKEKRVTHFFVIGDRERDGHDDQQRASYCMGIAALQLNVKFVISTGNIFCCRGVTSVDDDAVFDYKFCLSLGT